MDVKVYQKEEVFQPQGSVEVLTPDVIDIIPTIVEAESTGDVRNHVWTLEQLKRVAVLQLALRYGHRLLEVVDNSFVSLFRGHRIL